MDQRIDFTESNQDTAPYTEETMVNDPRASLTPSQMVEQKLVSLLQTSLPVSSLEAFRPFRR